MIVSTSGKTPDGSATTVANHPDIVAAKCPACTSSSVVPILYGAPSEVHVLLFTRRRAWPGGAMGRLLNRQAPQWHCNDCGHQWRGGLFAGGAGTCLGEAVVIRIGSTAVGVRAEKQWLTEEFGLDREIAGNPSGWTVSERVTVRSGGHVFDVLATSLRDGMQRTVCFDVTSFFGKIP